MPSYMPETLLQHSEVDYVVVGEGEAALVKLVASILKGDPKGVSVVIPGVACKIAGEISQDSTTVHQRLRHNSLSRTPLVAHENV